jgi:FkbM family methyltransferase
MPKICRYFAENRSSALVQFAVAKARRVLECYENANNYDFATNGEEQVLGALRSADIKRVFDVGANVGDWAKLASRYFPEAVIDCFEILPSTADELEHAVKGFERINVNRLGLSRDEGEVRLKTFRNFSELTSLVEVEHDFAEAGESVGRVMAGDDFCRERRIYHIDFLKIDVEAAEFLVMQGFSSMLSDRRIDVLQFEYGTGSIVSKFMLRDYYTLLTGFGYVVGKIYPKYVEFRDYHESHEDFIGPNMLAVNRERSDLIGMLS